MNCVVCGTVTDNMCGGCRETYCGVECQKRDWVDTHKYICEGGLFGQKKRNVFGKGNSNPFIKLLTHHVKQDLGEKNNKENWDGWYKQIKNVDAEVFTVLGTVYGKWSRDMLLRVAIEKMHSEPSRFVDFWVACSYHSGEITLYARTLADMRRNKQELVNVLTRAVVEHNELLNERDKERLMENARFIAEKLNTIIKNKHIGVDTNFIDVYNTYNPIDEYDTYDPIDEYNEYDPIDLDVPWQKKTFQSLMKKHAQDIVSDPETTTKAHGVKDMDAWLKLIGITQLERQFQDMMVYHKEYEAYVVAKIDDTNKDPNRATLQNAIQMWVDFWMDTLFRKRGGTMKRATFMASHENSAIPRLHETISVHFSRLKSFINSPSTSTRSLFIDRSAQAGALLDELIK